MPTESEYGVTLGEYRKFLESMNDSLINGLSAFADVLENQSASLLDKSIAAERQILRTYERMADLAAAAAHEARAEGRAGFEAGERFWKNISDAATQKAGQMYGQLEGQRLTSALNDIGNAKLLQALGFAGDVVDAAKYADALSRGDTNDAFK